MLGQTASPLRTPSGERFVMPLNSSPTALKRKLARNPVKLEDGTNLTFERIRAEFQAAAKGDFDPDVLDEAGKWFAQVGMLGFNPTDWMSTAFGHMRQQGFGADEAYRYAREMYTYGTRGRSAAELSVNYIFFPFSFQKKALTHLGDFLTDDLGRSLILHDMYKTYEILDERYDLDAMWEDHVPVMRNLQRLNLFAFGISPGRFGGINAQALESAGRLALGTVFSPNGVSIRDGIEGAELQKLTRSLLPVVNDVNWMLRDLKEQGHVLFSEAHMTTRAEIREGFNEWNEFKRQMTDTLGRSGYTLSDMHNKPWLRDQKLAYEARRAEIGARYPSWISYDQERIGNRVALDTEKRDRLAAAQADPSSVSAADAAMFAFESELDQIQQRLRLLGYDVGGRDGWSDAPPDVYNYIIARGVELRESVPGWQSVWEKFYRPEWGLLEAKI